MERGRAEMMEGRREEQGGEKQGGAEGARGEPCGNVRERRAGRK